MSEAGELVRELIAGGLSRRAIGQAVGRNDRLIGYVERGQKPGANLEPALRELRDRLAGGASSSELRRPVAAPPARRTSSSGRAARVRMRGVVDTGRSMTGLAKRQAAKNGARGLAGVIAEADARGQRLAFTLQLVAHARTRQELKSGKRGRRAPQQGWDGGKLKRRRPVLETVDVGDVEQESLQALVDDYGGDVVQACVAYAYEAGVISGEGVEQTAAEVVGVELRAY